MPSLLEPGYMVTMLISSSGPNSAMNQPMNPFPTLGFVAPNYKMIIYWSLPALIIWIG
jgi:hypothetical protein